MTSEELPLPETLGPREAAERLRAKAPELARRADFAAPDYQDEDGRTHVRWYGGPLSLPPGYSGPDPLVVDGDLAIDGFFFDGMSPATLIVVAGTLRARKLRTRGTILVGGDLIVDELVYANSSNDFQLYVGGDVKTPVFVEEGMRCEIVGDLVVTHALSLQGSVTFAGGTRAVPRSRDARGVLHPAILDAKGYPSLERVFEAMLEDEPLRP